MNIWLINPYGQIPGEGWRDYRFTILGKALSELGHQVVWWTAGFSHTFKRHRFETWKDISITPKFDIRLVPTTGYDKNISLARIRFESIFAWRTYQRARNQAPPDCIVATDPSQIVGYMSVRLAKRFDTPLILDVFDLWPELFTLALPRAIRFLAPIIFSPLYMLRRYNLGRSDALISLCNTYLEVANKEASKFRIAPAMTIFNGIELSAFRAKMPDVTDITGLAREFGKKTDEVWAIYTGSLGNNYDVKTLLKACLYLEEHNSHIKILVAGEGPLRPLVTEFILSHPYGNLTYLGEKLEPEELIKWYGVCDIALCIYTPESNVAMPNKFYDYAAAGLPIVNSLGGELEDFLRDHQIGIQYVAGDPISLAKALETLSSDKKRLKFMSLCSYNAAKLFDSNILYKKYVKFIESIAVRHAIKVER